MYIEDQIISLSVLQIAGGSPPMMKEVEKRILMKEEKKRILMKEVMFLPEEDRSLSNIDNKHARIHLIYKNLQLHGLVQFSLLKRRFGIVKDLFVFFKKKRNTSWGCW